MSTKGPLFIVLQWLTMLEPVESCACVYRGRADMHHRDDTQTAAQDVQVYVHFGVFVFH